MILISLVGEQPLPVLLPARALKPARVALIHTHDTQPVAERLARLLDAPVDYVRVEPFDVQDCQHKIRRYVKGARGTAAYNLTGGTKTMLMAAYMVAVTNRSAVLYLQTHGAVSRLYVYRIGSSGLVEREVQDLPTLISADDYLLAHLPGYAPTGFSAGEGGAFEQAVCDALRDDGNEVLAGVKPDGVAKQIDIDLFIRRGNQAGIAEVKLNKAGHKKKGVDQLATAGSRDYLGIYTAKFLIGTAVGSEVKQLARVRGIEAIELPSYSAAKMLSHDDKKRLIEAVKHKLGG